MENLAEKKRFQKNEKPRRHIILFARHVFEELIKVILFETVYCKYRLLLDSQFFLCVITYLLPHLTDKKNMTDKSDIVSEKSPCQLGLHKLDEVKICFLEVHMCNCIIHSRIHVLVCSQSEAILRKTNNQLPC